MKCPICGSLMDEGMIDMQGTALGFLFFGFSYKHLFFTDTNNTKIKILDNGEKISGYKCVNCKAVLMKE